MENEQNQCCLTSSVNLIPRTEDDESTRDRVGSPSNRLGSPCASPSSSHVAFISGERLHPNRPKTYALWHRRRTSLPTATRSTMWFVQASAIVVMLAVAGSAALVFTLREAEGRSQENGNAGLQMDTEDDRSAGTNSGTESIIVAGISPIHKLAPKSSNIDRVRKAVGLSAQEPITTASGIRDPATSVVAESGGSRTYDRFISPHPAKGSSSTVYGLGVKEAKDLHHGLSRPSHYVVETTGENHLGVRRAPPRLLNEGARATRRRRRLLRLDRKAWAEERGVKLGRSKFFM